MEVSKLRTLDLFSGIGGISLALKKYARTVAYCENDPFAQSILFSRIQSGDLDNAPLWDDIKTLTKEQFETSIDLITAGFPCQDVSSHGTQKGLGGKRSGLFYEVSRLIDALRPRFVFLENVSNITKKGLREVTAEITRLRYDCRWLIIPASAVGAPHPRKRWFMLAYADLYGRDCGSSDRQGRCIHGHTERYSKAGHQNWSIDELKPWEICADSPKGSDIATWNSNKEFLSGEIEPPMVRMVNELPVRLDATNWWDSEPNIERIAEDIPYQAKRIKALGNSVCPEQVLKAFEILAGLIKV